MLVIAAIDADTVRPVYGRLDPMHAIILGNTERLNLTDDWTSAHQVSPRWRGNDMLSPVSMAVQPR